MPQSSTRTVADLLAHLPASGRGAATRRAAERPRRVASRESAPRTEMERTVAALWQELFGIEHVSVEDNFFDLGGYSLLLVQAHGRLRKSLRRDIPIVSLLQYPTVTALATYLSGDARELTFDAVRERAVKQRSALNRRPSLLKS